MTDIVTRVVDDKESFSELILDLTLASTISLDLETSGLDYDFDYIVGFVFSTRVGEAYYIPVAHTLGKMLDFYFVVEQLKPILERPDLIVVGHNIFKFDMRFLRNIDIPHTPDDPTAFAERFRAPIGIHLHMENVHDTIMEVAVGSGGKIQHYGLKELEKLFYGIIPLEFDDLFPPKTRKRDKHFERLPISDVLAYVGADGSYTLDIHNSYFPRVENDRIYRLEHKLMPVTMDIEDAGVFIDQVYAEKTSVFLSDEVTKITQVIYDQIFALKGKRYHFDIASSDQVAKVIYGLLGLPATRFSAKTGAPATDELALEALAVENPICRNILTARSMISTANNLGKTLIESISPIDGKIHTNYSQWGTIAGRYSSASPNLQNLSKEQEWKVVLPDGSEYEVKIHPRDAVIADDDYYFLEFDFAAIEFAVACHRAGEEEVVAEYERGGDVHTQAAIQMFQLRPEDVKEHPKYRKLAKTCNYLMLYGGSEYRLSQQTQIGENEARDTISRFFTARPRLKRMLDQIHTDARRSRQVITMFGRRVYIKEYEQTSRKAISHGDRQSANAIIQGTAADYHKMGLIKVYNAIRARWSRTSVQQVLQTHDSQCLKVHKSIPPQEVVPVVVEAMSSYIQGLPHIRVDAQIGVSYGSLEAYNPDADYTVRLDELREEHKHAIPNVKLKPRDDDDERVGDPFSGKAGIIITFSPGRAMTAADAEQIATMLRLFEGENYVKIDTGGKEYMLTLRTSLDERTLREALSLQFPQGETRIEKESVMLKLAAELLS